MKSSKKRPERSRSRESSHSKHHNHTHKHHNHTHHHNSVHKNKESNSYIIDDQEKFIKQEILNFIETHNKEKEYTKKSSPNELPILKYKSQILSTVKDNKITFIEGEPGSGKSTQIPQYLLASGFCSNNKRIIITQPRRLATLSVTKRVAYELGCKVGDAVGYSIRFEERCSEQTRILYMTDGIFLRMLMKNPSLENISVVIIDEAHERSIANDIVLSILKGILQDNKDLRLIISSATLPNKSFKSFFNDPPMIHIPGRTFPVQVFYTKCPEANYIEAAVTTALQIHVKNPFDKGDILIFLTGQEEIELAVSLLNEKFSEYKFKLPPCLVLPLYAALPQEEQNLIFKPSEQRKIIISTNLAETSITLNNVCYVIDSGFSKQNYYNPIKGIESLIICPISQSSAIQRAGRAGRVKPGVAYRLYTKSSYDNLDKENIPNIQRENLLSITLLLKSLGLENIVDFHFIDKPPKEILMKSFEMLYALGAVNSKGILTKSGLVMSHFPMDPRLAKCLVTAVRLKCIKEMLIISSMLSVGDNIYIKASRDEMRFADIAHKKFNNEDGDHFALLKIYTNWRDNDYSNIWCNENYINYKAMNKSKQIIEQLKGILQENNLYDTEEEEIKTEFDRNFIINIKKCLIHGYFTNYVYLDRDGLYKTYKYNNVVNVHPTSVLFNDSPKHLLYHELVATNKDYMRTIISIEPMWLSEIAPAYYSNKLPK